MKRTTATWQRARSPEQKQARIDAILAAAGSLLDEEGLEGTGLNAIAREAGISKPNLYVYFESREAILLRLLLDEAASWSRALSARLRGLAGSRDIPAVARAFSATISRRRRLCILFGSVASVLEHNVGPETVAAFQRDAVELVRPAVSALAEALPPLTHEQAHSALGILVMSATGIWPHAHPAPVVRDVVSRPEFAHMKLDFAKVVEELALAYLRGVVVGVEESE